ncbi:hypothetical protein HDU96_010273 [Phlyctochytrium bullatum]|nr:hypothetical protein HDU96_010273 [Phlyctochytrium bullatum]
MFWRFGFHSASAIDALLDKENLTLEELFEEEELLQECKSHNAKLIELYPYLSCEVLSCEIYAVCEAAITNTELLTDFWKLLDKPAPLNALQASYFSKVNNVFFQKKAGEMVTFVRNQPNVVKKILSHIGTSAIADLLLKIISVEEVPEGQGVVQWLARESLIPSLIDRLEPNEDVEVHNTAAQTLLDIIAVSYQNLSPLDALQSYGADGTTPASLSGGNLLVDELKSAAIMGKLVGFMLDKNAKHSTSTLTNGINIVIELIRRYCSEIEQAEYQQHQYHTQMAAAPMERLGPPVPSDAKLCALAIDLNELLKVIGERLGEFAGLLTTPRNLSEIDTTLGRQVPLGSERLKTCELFAEVLHLQYLYTSSPLFERLVPRSQLPLLSNPAANRPETPDVTADPAPPKDVEAKPEGETKEAGEGEGEAKKEAGEMVKAEGEAAAASGDAGVPAAAAASTSKVARWEHMTVSDELSIVTEQFVDSRILPMCLELFFQYEWNNFLHSVVYDMIAKVFNTYSFTSTANLRPPPQDGEGFEPSPSLLAAEERLRKVKESVYKLVVSILLEGRLTERITQAQRANDYNVGQPKGVRLGYMGHLTYISDEVCKLIDKCSADFDGQVKAMVVAEEWQEYLNGVLRETKERDRQPLGGVRPTQTTQPLAVPLVTGLSGFGAGGNLDDSDIGVTPGRGAGAGGNKESATSGDGSDDEDDDLSGGIGASAGEFAGDGDVASDQVGGGGSRPLVRAGSSGGVVDWPESNNYD